MSAKQVGFVVLVALMGLMARQPEVAHAAPGKCNAGCWNMTPTDWRYNGTGKCYSYTNGIQGEVHAPVARMGTTKAIGGAWTKQSNMIQEFKSTDDCDATCIGTTPIEATPRGTGNSYNGDVLRYKCQ